MLKLRCDVGVFLLEPSGNGYWGEANGITCETDGKSVTVRHGKEEHFFFFEGRIETALDVISEKIDSAFEHLLDNDDEDVRFLRTSNGKIAYYQYNTHLPGYPVVFVHGGPGGDSGTARARRLRLDRPVFLYDQSGGGRSDKITDLEHWNHDSFARELEEIINLMGFEKVSFVSASWGAGLSAMYAINTRCSKIESMVLVSPFFSTKIWEEDQMRNLAGMGGDWFDIMQKCIEGKGSREEYVKVMEEYDSRYLFSQECNREIAIAAANEEPNEVFKAMVGENEMHTTGNMLNFDITDRLDRITVPVLLLNGDSDEVRIDTIENFHRKIRGSELRIIRGAGHALSFEQFESYRDEIQGFL